jgi:hypothetical protein
MCSPNEKNAEHDGWALKQLIAEFYADLHNSLNKFIVSIFLKTKR